MQIVFSDRFTAGLALLDTDIRQLDVVTTASGSFLYTATGVNGGLACYDLSTATPVLLDTAYFSSAMRSMGMVGLDWLTTSTNARLIFGITQAGDMLTANVAAPGDLGSLATIYLDDAYSPWLQSGLVSTLLSNGTQMVYVADAISGALEGYTVSDRARVAHVSSTPGDVLPTLGPVLLETVNAHGADYLLRADDALDGVDLYRIEANGSLTRTGQLGAENGLGVNTPTVMGTVQAWGETFVILGAAGSSSLSVMRIAADGSLQPTDHLLDTLETRFGNISALEVVTVGDRVFVAAAGADSGLTLFTLLPQGQLLYLQTLEHQFGFGLENITALESSVDGTTLSLFAASGTEAGLSRLTLDLASLGVTESGASTGAVIRTGDALDDFLISNSIGADTLLGNAGDDILVSGPGATQMFGGTGNDLFVIRPGVARHYVMDWEAGDRLDLSALPMLRSTAQLEATSTSRGVLLRFQGYEIEIVARDGQPMGLSDIFSGLSLGGADRVMVLGTGAGQWLLGGVGPDTLRGGTGNDTLSGEGADDRLEAGAGDDVLDGGSGNDALFGAAGNDTLLGADGHDFLAGEAGNDDLFAGAGNDLVLGGTENDTIRGDAGNDTLFGEDGDDRLEAGADDDYLDGGLGNDALFASGGNDTLIGGAGHDFLAGEAGADDIFAGEGNDLVLGGTENDTIRGEAGNDTLFGEDGDDRLEAGADDDYLDGGLGNDALFASGGNDTLIGGAGHDFLAGEAGADDIFAGEGNDLVLGGTENDTIRGEAGNDTLWGEDGDDRLEAGADDDYLDGGLGNDALFAATGNDTLFGGAGHDFLAGELGHDVLEGGAGNDLLLGGGENDTLSGGLGDDTLWGEAGADVFVFASGDGADVIGDFSAASGDRINLTSLTSVADFATLISSASALSGATLLDFGADGSLTLIGLSPAVLQADWFFFA
ncbi:Ca2+-binding RTX toxin-like protein [Rhodobacter sp. JA431]|uniref:calcium-binding protein n=1 Tax=Rhodobacter sp. JA431 TaxID=570013 RepID=UPI000BD87B09|nr:calcium-binding protein [Rhodobacter sp. JA431]SOC08246.1 Ca2+-binding RTX toxin-like protein [Rhodobacter sp. JA431]